MEKWSKNCGKKYLQNIKRLFQTPSNILPIVYASCSEVLSFLVVYPSVRDSR